MNSPLPSRAVRRAPVDRAHHAGAGASSRARTTNKMIFGDGFERLWSTTLPLQPHTYMPSELANGGRTAALSHSPLEIEHNTSDETSKPSQNGLPNVTPNAKSARLATPAAKVATSASAKIADGSSTPRSPRRRLAPRINLHRVSSSAVPSAESNSRTGTGLRVVMPIDKLPIDEWRDGNSTCRTPRCRNLTCSKGGGPRSCELADYSVSCC